MTSTSDTPSIRTMADVVRTHAAQKPHATAMTAGSRSWTYGALDSESNRVAQALLTQGVDAEDRVAFLDKNSPEYFTYLFGASKVNAVTVAVNWRLAPKEMEYILENSEAKTLLIGEEFLDALDQMELTVVEQVIVIGTPRHDEQTSYEEWIAGQPDEDTGIDAAGTDTCYQLYTSGTTGLPKGVELTNDNFFSMLHIATEEWRFDEQSVSLVAMPLFHIAGSGWGVVSLYMGAQAVLMRDVDPMLILQVIPEFGVTNAILVPAVLQILQQIPQAQETDFSSLRSMVYGASPITEEVLVGAMKMMGCEFMQAYGLTETTGGATILRSKDHDPGGPRANLLRSAGEPWGDTELKIIDAETLAEMPDGEVGEILIKSSQNMKGYWKNPQATEEAFLEGGWFRTGDAGYLQDGYLFIHDRVKDMIVSGGENIYPAEVENALMAHDEIADVAVIGVPSEKWGETVKAIVVPAPGTEPNDREVIAYCRERLAHYKCPTSVDFTEAIPRNPSGKILKTELRKPFWEGRDRMV
ncbi:MAG: long-chain-fatty-acid--CoA ligase [Acidobacteriota bacterium]